MFHCFSILFIFSFVPSFLSCLKFLDYVSLFCQWFLTIFIYYFVRFSFSIVFSMLPIDFSFYHCFLFSIVFCIFSCFQTGQPGEEPRAAGLETGCWSTEFAVSGRYVTCLPAPQIFCWMPRSDACQIRSSWTRWQLRSKRLRCLLAAMVCSKSQIRDWKESFEVKRYCFAMLALPPVTLLYFSCSLPTHIGIRPEGSYSEVAPCPNKSHSEFRQSAEHESASARVAELEQELRMAGAMSAQVCRHSARFWNATVLKFDEFCGFQLCSFHVVLFSCHVTIHAAF